MANGKSDYNIYKRAFIVDITWCFRRVLKDRYRSIPTLPLQIVK